MQKIRYLRLFVSTKSVYLILYYPAVSDSGAKLSKSFEKMIIEVLILYMVIPGKIILSSWAGSECTVSSDTVRTSDTGA